MLDLGAPDKAKIKIIKASEYTKTASEMKIADTDEVLTVAINPQKLSITDGVTYTNIKKMNKKDPRTVPRAQYASHKPRTLSVELLFDTYTSIYIEMLKKDVKKEYIDKFTKLITNQKGEPPRVFFSWGSIQFMGLVTSMSYTYTMFTSSGKPVRANMNLTITEYDF